MLSVNRFAQTQKIATATATATAGGAGAITTAAVWNKETTIEQVTSAISVLVLLVAAE